MTAISKRLDLRTESQQFISSLRAFFGDSASQTLVTGGFLRDLLLGRDPHDIDLSTDEDTLAIGARLAGALGGHFVLLDQERGQVRVVVPGAPLWVDLLPLQGEIVDDLQRRDYTINALAVSLAEIASPRRHIIDPLGGMTDLSRGLLRAVRETNLREDPLRLLRGVRLAAELDFEIEEETAQTIARNAHLLPMAAGERLHDELMRIFATPRSGAAVRTMDRLGLLDAILPEVAVGRGVVQPKEHHWDVFNHCLEAVERLDILLADFEPAEEPWSEVWRTLWASLQWWSGARARFREEVSPGVTRLALLKLGGLLHDIGKPETKLVQQTGRIRFFGHEDVGALIAAKLLRRLRFSGTEISLIRNMIEAHLRPVQMAQQAAPTRRALYRYFRDVGDAAIETLFLSLADHLATVGPRLDMAGWRNHVALVNYVLVNRFREDAIVAPPRLVRGGELMAEFGLEAGPVIGGLLEQIREAQAAGEISSREEAIELARVALQETAETGASRPE